MCVRIFYLWAGVEECGETGAPPTLSSTLHTTDKQVHSLPVSACSGIHFVLIVRFFGGEGREALPKINL